MRAPVMLPGLLVVLSLAVAGCGSDGGSDSTSASTTAGAASAAAPAGDTVSGTGYETTVPTGWRDGSEAAEGTAFKIDLLYASPKKATFQSNVVITREDPDVLKGKKVEDIEEQVRTTAAGAVGAKTPDAEEPTKIDGEDAARWTLRRDQSGVSIVQRQAIAIHDDALYTITLSSPADADEGEAQLGTIVSGWRWK